jgi:hypothetical protein
MKIAIGALAVTVLSIGVVPSACVCQAQAAWQIDLPEGGVGFKFGNLVIPPLKNVLAATAYSDQTGFGLVAPQGVSHAGGQWPDPLTGSYIGNLTGKPYQFKAKIPNGEYLVWLAAGRIIRADAKDRHFLLKLNDKLLVDETPTDDEFAGDRYLYRFLWTQYSEKPHAVWLNYIDKMYPAEVHAVQVTQGTITVEAANHFLSALIVVPAARKAEFEKMVADIRLQRQGSFERGLGRTGAKAKEKGVPSSPARPERGPNDSEAILYVPREPLGIDPWTVPAAEERRQTKVEAAGAPGQKVAFALAVTPWTDLGKSSLVVSDLTGPGVISAGHVEGYYRNYRFNGRDYDERENDKTRHVREMCLVPTLSLELEKGVTFCYWLRLKVPEDAKPGQYRGTITLACEGGKKFALPLEFEVYPFKLEAVLPVSYGFWGGVGAIPQFFSEAAKRQLTRARLESMVDLGLTATTVDIFTLKALKPGGGVELNINQDFAGLVKEAGMGRHPEQAQLVSNIMASMGRPIAARLPGGGGVWHSPGIEMRLPGFEQYFKDAARQHREFFKKLDLPVAINAVDEPREFRINSWNRNYADTIRYCDWLAELGGIRVCCNPMSDVTHGKDYTPMIDHVDVLSTHAWKNSERFMKGTLAKGRTLWLFNCGRDRYSYGFYNWRWKSHGRWEWQFMEQGDGAVGGYPGREWYNPFTDLHSSTNCAPQKYKGGLLYQSHFFDLSEGIADYAYLYTLEQLLKAARGPKAEEARAWLAALQRAMPEFPQVRGLASPQDGPKVGLGLDEDARLKVGAWRRAVAGFIKELKRTD